MSLRCVACFRPWWSWGLVLSKSQEQPMFDPAEEPADGSAASGRNGPHGEAPKPGASRRGAAKKPRARKPVPTCLPDGGAALFLGWTGTSHKPVLGFRSLNAADVPQEPLTYGGDGHLMTVAPTGAGKGVGAIIPALLTYPGSII